MIRRSHTLRDLTDKSGSVVTGHWQSLKVHILYAPVAIQPEQRLTMRDAGLGTDRLIDRERFCVTAAYLEPAEGSILYVDNDPDMAGFSVRTHRGIYEIW